MTVSREDAETALAPHRERLRQCIVGGFEAWQDLGLLAPQYTVNMKPRTRAGFIFDQIVPLVERAFAGVRDARIVQKRGFPELIVGSADVEYVIRFKKLDKKGRSRSILTRQTRLWLEQQLGFAEMTAEQVNMIAGYVLDDLGASIDRVMLACPKDTKSNHFAFTVEPEVAKVVQMYQTQSAPKPPTVRSSRAKTQGDSGSDEPA